MDNVDEMIKTRSIPNIPVTDGQEDATTEVEDETGNDEDEINSASETRNWMLGFAVVTGVVATAIVNFS